jgi:hypothetical protein
MNKNQRANSTIQLNFVALYKEIKKEEERRCKTSQPNLFLRLYVSAPLQQQGYYLRVTVASSFMKWSRITLVETNGQLDYCSYKFNLSTNFNRVI